MPDDATKPTAEVIELRPAKATKASEKKWGKAVMERGFCVVPSLLLRAQPRLKLTPTQLAVLMHLADYWWDVARKPYPSKKALAERLGLGERQVQRIIAQLEEMGFVKRIERIAKHRGKLSNEYDLDGLVTRLKEIEPEFRKVEEEVKRQRRAVARPGLKDRRVSRSTP
jgi:predicted transcriptional regulator